MSVCTYQQFYEFTEGEYVEKETSYNDEGYKYKFPEYYIFRLTNSNLYQDVKKSIPNSLDLDFIKNAVPEGEGDLIYHNPDEIKEQLLQLKNGLLLLKQNTALNQDDIQLLTFAEEETNKLISLSEYAKQKNYLIGFGLDC